jgi:diguanylate cyclase (GGDEF)-like protein
MIFSHQQTRTNTMHGPTDVPRTVQPSAPASLDIRGMELTSILQTTLDVEQLLELFSNALYQQVQTQGLQYHHDDEALDLSFGECAGHRANYDLVVEAEPLGRVELYRNRPFADAELEDVENLLCALIYPLRNALTYRQAVERALRDPLTGVQNRAALSAAVEREAEASRRHGMPLAMVVFDIDRFKMINDTYGHSFGDDVLRAIAHTADSTIRRCDQLFRFGGEEFVVLASHTDRDGASQLAERIRRAIESINSVDGQDMSITVSLGVAMMPPGKDAEELFDRADQALYQAKQGGRNCYVVAS